MHLHERGKAETQPVLSMSLETKPANAVQQEARFEIGSGGEYSIDAHTIAQVQLLCALFDGTEQPLQAAAQIGRLADVGLGLRVGSAQQEDSRGGRAAAKTSASRSGANSRRSVSTISILVGFHRENTEETSLPSGLRVITRTG
jgi:hypothetical protein